MPPSSKPWFRFYVEALHDRKLRRQKPEHRWLFVAVLAIARASSDHGFLRIGNQPATVEDICDVAALTPSVTKRGLAALTAEGLLHFEGGAWRVVKWDERQFESDISTDRVKAFRERQRNVSRNDSVTPPESESKSDTEFLPNPSVNGDPQNAPSGPDDDIEQRIRAVLERIADTRLTSSTRPITNRERYRSKILAQLPDELDLPRLRRITENHPDAPVEMLADAALGNATPYLKDYRVEPATA